MRAHFIAIGGSVMHQAGLLVENGWHPERIHEKPHAFILGMHAKTGNPKLQRAVELGLKIFSIEKRPQFHFLYPSSHHYRNPWDHINVFPTYEIYPEQFRIFIDKIEPGGLLIYNGTDEACVKVVKQKNRKDIRNNGDDPGCVQVVSETETCCGF